VEVAVLVEVEVPTMALEVSEDLPTASALTLPSSQV
jgi:hypothetical protein